MNDSLQSAYGPKGTVWIYRKNPVGQFSWGPGGNCASADEAYEKATEFRSRHRRAERCSIWIQPEGGDYTELSPAGAAEPVKGERASKARREKRKARREERKEDVIAIRERIRAAKKFSDIGIEVAETESKVVRREGFKEMRARASHKQNLRVLHWKAKGETIVTGPSVAAFR